MQNKVQPLETKDGETAVYMQSRLHWRKWLEQNHASSPPVWLILYHKKSKTPSVTQSEAVEEALCFGWIDSLCKKRDSESFYLTFSQRKTRRSNWSKSNIERAMHLISEGKMAPSGLKFVEIAQKEGMWNI